MTTPRLPGIVKYTTYEGETRLDPYIPESWGNNDKQHSRIYDWGAINQYFQQGKSIPSRYKWAELHCKVSSPFDNLMNEWMLDQLVKAWNGHVDVPTFPGLPSIPLSIPGMGQGRCVRATMWWKGGFPMFEYTIFLEYDDGSAQAAVRPPAANDIYDMMGANPVSAAPDVPGIAPIVVGNLVIILVTILGVAVALKMLGFDAGSVQGLAQAPFAGTTWVFMLGTAFLVALTYFQQHAGIKAPIRPAAPSIPQVGPTAPIEMAERTSRLAGGGIGGGRRRR